MYKILIKLDTKNPSIYHFYQIKNDQGEMIDYATSSKDEAKIMTLELIKKFGYKQLKVVQDEPFYINIIPDNDFEPFNEEEINDMLKLLEFTGQDDLVLTKRSDYSLDFKWGLRPEKLIPTYTINFDGDNVEFSQTSFTDVLEDSSVINEITFLVPSPSFHLIVKYDDKEESYGEGLPEWIQYIPLSENKGQLILTGINKDYNITVHLD